MDSNYNARLAPRLVGIVEKKLGVAVNFSHWQLNRDGSETPVFHIPNSHHAVADALGLFYRVQA